MPPAGSDPARVWRSDAGVEGSVDPALFSTVAQVVPVIALAAVLELIAYWAPRVGRGEVDRGQFRERWNPLAIQIAATEGLALWAVGAESHSRAIAFVLGAAMLLQAAVLTGFLEERLPEAEETAGGDG